MKLSIAKEFTTAPGPRYIREGKHSGEAFRVSLLLLRVREAIDAKEKLTIDLDGTSGYGTSFLEEAFGGLIRYNSFTLNQLDALLEFNSTEEPDLIDEINEYLREAEDVRVGKTPRD